MGLHLWRLYDTIMNLRNAESRSPSLPVDCKSMYRMLFVT